MPFLGATGDILVEGPFAVNEPFLQLLHAASGRPVLAQKSSRTGTSIGAALLAVDTIDRLAPASAIPVTSKLLSGLAAYGQEWRKTAQMA